MEQTQKIRTHTNFFERYSIRVFNTAYGVGFLTSGAVCGLLMDLKPSFITVMFYVLVMQITAMASLLSIRSKLRKIT